MPVDTKEFDKFILKVASELSEPVVAQIVTNDPEVEKYWPVLEFGSEPASLPWPEPKERTRYGPDGRIFSRQAPKGFIRSNGTAILGYLRAAYSTRVEQKRAPLSRTELIRAVNETATKALDLLRASIPVRTGKARASLALKQAE